MGETICYILTGYMEGWPQMLFYSVFFSGKPCLGPFFMVNNCDVLGQNQSHVAKHKIAEICIFSENVKICPFFVFIKNKIFVQVSVT